MNYLKKIKSLGFKKIQPIVLCEYSYSSNTSGYYITTLQNALNDVLKENGYVPRFIKDPKRVQSYIWKISNTVSIYLILHHQEYTIFVSDSAKKIYKRDHYYKTDSINIISESLKLNPNFWKDTMSKLDKDITREIAIKEIFKFQ